MSSVPPDPTNGQNTVIVNLSENQPPTMWIPPGQQKLYQCGLCSVMFDINIELVFHVKKHSLTKPYQCGYCKVSYDSNVELTFHHGKARGCALLMRAPEPPKTGVVGEGREECFLSPPATQSSSASSEKEIRTGGDVSDDFKSDSINRRKRVATAVSDSVSTRTKDSSVLKGAGAGVTIGKSILTSDCGVENSCKEIKPEIVEMLDPNQYFDEELNVHFEQDRGTSRVQKLESKTEISDLKHVNDVENNSSDKTFHKASLICEATMSSVIRSTPVDSSRTTDKETGFKCPCCEKVLDTNTALKVHRDTVHPDEKHFVCTLCSRSFHNRFKYQEHMACYHSDVKRFPCSICPARLKNRSCLNQHMRVHHSLVRHHCAECKRSYKNKYDLNRHWCQPRKCSVCDTMLTSLDSYKSHMTLQHPADSVTVMHPCAECKRSYKYKCDLNNHWCKPRKCPLCDSMLLSLVTYKSHMRVQHGSVGTEIVPVVNIPSAEEPGEKSSSREDLEHKCAECGKCFPKKNNLIQHWCTPRKCSICDTMLRSKETYKSHMTLQHPPDSMKITHQCAECKRSYKYKCHLNNHWCKPRKCPLCDRMLLSLMTYKSHMRVQHGSVGTKKDPVVNIPSAEEPEIKKKNSSTLESEHKCDKCGKCFPRKNNLIQHWCTPRKCSICDTMLRSKETYKSHMTLQHPPDSMKITHQCAECKQSYKYKCDLNNHWCKPRKCSLCDSMLLSLVTYKGHMKLKHSNSIVGSGTQEDPTEKKPPNSKTFQCNHCDKVFATKKTLVQHSKMHTEIKPYICEFCGKSYRRPDGLKYHRNIHLNSKPYKCRFCPREFTSRPSQDMHERHHIGDKRYSCDQCGKSFYNSGSLKRHALTHTDIRAYVCKVCSKTYRSTSALRHHLQHSHHL